MLKKGGVPIVTLPRLTCLERIKRLPAPDGGFLVLLPSFRDEWAALPWLGPCGAFPASGRVWASRL